jgi:hypothetical protein
MLFLSIDIGGEASASALLQAMGHPSNTTTGQHHSRLITSKQTNKKGKDIMVETHQSYR